MAKTTGGYVRDVGALAAITSPPSRAGRTAMAPDTGRDFLILAIIMFLFAMGVKALTE